MGGGMSPTARSEIDPEELKRKLDAGEDVLVVDVREPDEFEDWHIPDAVNLPLDDVVGGEDPPGDPDREVVTVCARGVRSEDARRALHGRGWTVRSLAGGMLGWNRVFDLVEIPSGDVTVVQIRRVGKGCLSYLVSAGGEAVAVDPTHDVETYVQAAGTRDLRIVGVLDTHAHADHVSGGRALSKRTGAPYLGPNEVADVCDRTIEGGDTVEVGPVQLDVLATPGHTPGSLSYRVHDLLLAGDTLSTSGVGRPDLGRDARTQGRVLWETLHGPIADLPGEITILPGHAGRGEIASGEPVEARLDDLRADVEALTMDRARFLAWLDDDATPTPENFHRIKEINTGRAPLPKRDEIRELEVGPNRCAVDG